MLHTVARKKLNLAVIHHYGEMHDDLARRGTENLPKTWIEVQLACCKVKSSALGFPGIDLLLERNSCHFEFSPIPYIEAPVLPHAFSLPVAAFQEAVPRSVSAPNGLLYRVLDAAVRYSGSVNRGCSR